MIAASFDPGNHSYYCLKPRPVEAIRRTATGQAVHVWRCATCGVESQQGGTATMPPPADFEDGDSTDSPGPVDPAGDHGGDGGGFGGDVA